MSHPLKWHGGKGMLAPRILPHFPPHLTYVEPFAGAMSLLFARDDDGEGVNEIANDLHGDLMGFWRVLQSPPLFADLRRRAEACPYSRELWEEACHGLQRDTGDPVQRALWLMARHKQSLGGRGDGWSPTSKARTRRGMGDNVSAWLSAIEGLPAIHARLQRVTLERRPAVEVIRRYDGPDTFFYCDPPYLRETRAAPDVYACEMSEADHRELLARLLACQGRVMLSGYPSALYDELLSGWRVVDMECGNHAASRSRKRRMVERLWMNYPPLAPP